MQTLSAITRRQWNGMFLLILFVAGVWLVPTLHLQDCDVALESSAQCGERACHSDLGSGTGQQPSETTEPLDHCPICRVKGIFLEAASTAMLPCLHLLLMEELFHTSGRLAGDPAIHYFHARGPPVQA